MIKVKLTKLSNNKNNLRTKDVEGIILNANIKPGIPVTIFSEPIEKEQDIRFVSTSNVVDIIEENENNITFNTFNSRYKLEFL